MAGILFLSCLLLVYSAIVVPVQIFVWDYSDPCHAFPTLNLDIFIDSFFIVSFLEYAELFVPIQYMLGLGFFRALSSAKMHA